MRIFKNSSSSHHPGFIALALTIATIAVYWQVNDFEFISFDDPLYVSENEHVQQGLNIDNMNRAFSAFKTDAQTYWHPLTTMSHMLDCHLFGLNPGMHHIVNLVIHTTNVLLLFLALHLMTGAPWRSGFAAALFALHPINVDSVAWIAERKNLLSTMFWMLTMLAYIVYARKPGFLRYGLIFCVFSMGLLAKPMLVTLPCVLLLLDFWPMGRLDLRQTFIQRYPESGPAFQPAGISRLIIEKIPMFVLSIGAIALSTISLQLNNQLLDAGSVPVTLRIENAVVSYITYLWKMIWPTRLAVFYPFPEFIPLWQTICAAFFLVAISAMIFTRARKLPWLATGWLWYLGTLVPVIGLVQGGLWPALADRWAYIPFMGIFIIIAWHSPTLIPHHRLKNAVVALMAIFLLLTLSIASWRQAGHWKNTQTLFKHALTVTSDNYIAHNNLGNTFFRQNQIEEAINHFTLAIKIKPDYPETHYNLANALRGVGKTEKAIMHYRQAIALQPNYYKACNNLANLLLGQDRTEEAILFYKRALLINPNYIQAQKNLAQALKQSEGVDTEINFYLQAVKIRPNDERAHLGLAMALFSAGRASEAFQHFFEALKINPNFADAHYHLANAYKNQGQLNQASLHYSKAADINPGNEKALHNLATVLMNLGRTDDAITNFRKALEINPNSENTHYNLGIAYFNTGNITAAVESFKEALLLNPEAENIRSALSQVTGK